MRRVKRVKVWAYAGCCLAAIPGAALAQETQESDAQTNTTRAGEPVGASAEREPETSSGVTEIIVTAQFREQRLQDTPIAITALSGELLEARGQTNLTDIGKTAPNVTIQSSQVAYGNSAAIAIRGVGQYDNHFAVEPGVGIYIDDVYYPTLYGAQLDLLDLDRVEVLRGPQGTLAGKNSIGGAIRLFTKQPTGSGGGFAEATVGSFDRIDLRAGVDIPLVENTLAMRLSGVFKHTNGFMDRVDFKCRNPDAAVPTVSATGDCVIGQEGGQDFKGLRAALAWTPNDRLTVDLMGDIYNDQSQPNAAKLVAVRPTSPNAPQLTPFLDTAKYETYSTYQSQRGYGYSGTTNLDGYGISARIGYDLSDFLSVTSITAYRKYDAFYEIDLDGTAFGLVTEIVEPAFGQFSQEIRLSGDLAEGLLDFTAGGYYYSSESTYGGYIEINNQAIVPPATPGFALANFIQDDEIDSESKSAFLTVGIHPFEGLNVNLGGRYTDESKDLTFIRREAVTFQPLAPLNGQVGEFARDRFDYRVAVDYRFNPSLLVYGSIATGFKGGGVNPRPYRAEQVVPFGPETLTAYELGLKSDLFDRMVRLNLSAFINKYEDIQLNITNGVGIYAAPAIVPVNAGDADVKGLEAEATIRPTDALTLDGSISYLDFEYVDLLPAIVASGIQPDFITPFTPEWKWSVGAQYDAPIAPDQTISPRVDVSYQSEIYANAINSPNSLAPGYTLANARLIYRHEDLGITATAAVNNVFDKYYFLSRYDNLYNAVGTTLASIGRPREFMFTLKYDF